MSRMDGYDSLSDDRWPAAGEAARRLPLLRNTHIFASLVREVLERKYLQEVAPDPLTFLQFQLLKLIALNGGYQVGEVANFLGVSPPAVTKNIDKLERLGLIVRARSDGDRRATLLSPSAAGRRLVGHYEGHKAERLTPVLKEFSPEELHSLAQLLERFSLSLLRHEDTDGGVCLRCAAYCEDDCSIGRLRGECPYRRHLEAHASSGDQEASA
ncbi:MAG: MarR family transcriptional regulator [Phycisphaerales bacterium]|nr:MAG: MarR family transcriptional regulator [Phycisphaerales bacterium]